MDTGTNMADVLEIFADTGEVIERDFTPEELAQREVDAAAYAAAQAQAEAEAAAKVAARESAMQKLAGLGLNEQEISAIIGNIS